MAGSPKETQRAQRESGVSDELLRVFVGYRLKRAYLAVEREVNAILSEHGMRVATFSALAVVIENPDLSQSMLAEALELKRSTVVVIVDQLEGEELIQRRTVANDRRSNALRATLRGRRLYERIAAAILEREIALEAGLDPADRLAMNRSLSRIEGRED